VGVVEISSDNFIANLLLSLMIENAKNWSSFGQLVGILAQLFTCTVEKFIN